MTTTPYATCIQEQLDNSTLTVRFQGKILGRVHRDAPNKWIVRPPEPPEWPVYPSLEAAVDALVEESLK